MTALAKKSLLAEAVRRHFLLNTLRDRLAEASLRDLVAVDRWLNARQEKKEPGRPPQYAEQYLRNVQDTVHREMNRLRKAGKKRFGPKTAIKSLIDQTASKHGARKNLMELHERSTENGISKFDELVLVFFKQYEAARKRG
jgi:hypothetical protein